MPRRSSARKDAVKTAARLFQRQGYHGTGLKQILDESGAPKGSFYFHFPGGKEQLAQEAVELAQRQIGRLFERVASETKTLRGFVTAIAYGLAHWLEASDFRDGCPIATVTLEMSPHNDALTEACRAAFTGWQHCVAEFLSSLGAAPTRANRLATLIVSAFEGAFVLARAEASTRPFTDVATTLAELSID